MKKLGTRLGSLALAFAMLLSLLPVSAQAADEPQTVVQPERETVTAELQAAHIVGDAWVDTDALTMADGVYTFQDTADDVYESVGSTNFQSETETWEGDTTIETEVYIDPAQFETGEGFTMVCDILPTWRAFVVSIRKLDSGEMLIDFSNNSSYAISENPANNQMKISKAGWYACRWELFDQDGQVAGEFYLNDTQVGITRTNAADTIATSYFRKFWIPTYGPQPIGGGQTENKEICAGKSVQFKEVTKTVDLPTWNVSSTEELTTAIAEAKSGDTICLAAGEYSLADLVKSRTTGASTLIIDKSINLVGAVDENNNPATVFKGNNNSNDDAINIVGGVDVTIENIYFTEFGGNMTNNNVILAGSTDQAFTGTLNVKNCNID